jgi:hypothetical protein
MITFSQLTLAQERWLALIKHYFPKVYSSGKITYAQLKEAHKYFVSLRATDKKFKVGFPIWLQTNNALEHGVYKLPIEGEDVVTEEISEEEKELLEEMRSFGIDV